MKKILELTGWYTQSGFAHCIETLTNPSQRDLIIWLNTLQKANEGKLKLENLFPETDTSPEDLTLYFSKNNYLLMLFDFDPNGEANVRSTYDPTQEGFINILGDNFHRSLITHDFEIVKRCFLEFSTTLTVSNTILI